LKTKDQGDVAHVLRSDGRSKWMEGRMWVRRDAKQLREIRRDAGCIRRIDAIKNGLGDAKEARGGRIDIQTDDPRNIEMRVDACSRRSTWIAHRIDGRSDRRVRQSS
jgi:hypothetical protein